MLYIYQSDLRANHSNDSHLSQLTNMNLKGAEYEKHAGMIIIALQKILKP